jgi:hypothetical protein
VQYHPEASPGPHDADYLFQQFLDAMDAAREPPHAPIPAECHDAPIQARARHRLRPDRDRPGCEFDYSGTQACKALRAEGLEVVLVNSNPATIMTDPELADRTYVEPLTPEMVEAIIARERPDAVLPTVGGQTALNLAVALHERACSRSTACS